MELDSIKNYIKSYQNSYSKDQIIAGLRQQGVSDNDINQAYISLENNNNNNSKKSNKTVLIVVLVSIFIFLLLPIIIVSIIYFSVDYSTLLSNQLDLTNNLRGDPSQLVLSSSENTIKFVVTYTGSRAGEINPSEIFFKSDLGWSCDSSVGVVEVQNIDTGRKVFSTEDGSVKFINGQLGVIMLKCPESSLLNGEQIEGEVQISVVDTRNELEIVSKGRMRAMVD